MHPTVKPVALVADAVRDCSHRGGIVLDVFMGSGTTLIAAEQTGRRAYGLEIDPGYVDIAIRRWQTRTGGRAVHAGTDIAFDELTAQRAPPPDALSERTSLQDRDAIPQNTESYS